MIRPALALAAALALSACAATPAALCRDGEPLKPHSVVSFLCSGKLLTFDAVVIERIEFRETGSVHCEGCDQRVARSCKTGNRLWRFSRGETSCRMRAHEG